MTREQFREQMGRLEFVFQVRNPRFQLPPETMDEYFDVLGGFNGQHFKATIDDILAESEAPRFFPFPGELAARTARQARTEKHPQKIRDGCGRCWDGIVKATLALKNQGNFLFRCDCPAGSDRRESYPQWSDAWITKYTRVDRKKFSIKEVNAARKQLRGQHGGTTRIRENHRQDARRAIRGQVVRLERTKGIDDATSVSQQGQRPGDDTHDGTE